MCFEFFSTEIKMKINDLKRGLEDCVKCLYLHVCCSTVTASVADSHRPRGYYVKLGLQASALSEVMQQGVAPEDCLTDVGI